MNSLNNTIKKAKELETTLLRVKELINSIAESDDIVLSVNSKELAKATYESFQNSNRDIFSKD